MLAELRREEKGNGGGSAGNVDLTVSDEVYDVDADTSVGSVSVEVSTDPSASRHIIAESSAGSITVRPVG